MYGAKGKVVLLLLFALGGGLAGLVWVNKIGPALQEKCSVKVESKSGPKGEPDKGGADKKADDTPHTPINDLDRLLTLPVRDAGGKVVKEPGFNGGETGTMARAFFDKDKSKVFQKLMDDATAPQPEKDKLKAQRQAELDAVVAWVRSPEAARKLAYETDGFDAPAAAPKLDPRFVNAGKVRVKAIIDARCAACHAPGEKQEDYPLTNYDELSQYLKPIVPEAAPEPPAPAPQPNQTPVPVPAKAVTPIPPAKDD
jgi:mono/diheme cytochrome c family protein